MTGSPAVGTPLWADGVEPLDLRRLEGTVTADVCVVGLGGSGLSCVAELRRRGASVVGLDARAVADGAAGRNGGFLLAGLAMFHHHAVAAIGRERAARLYRLTLAEMDRIATEAPAHVRRVGSLRIADSADEAADCEAQLAAMRADGLPAEPYDGPEGRGLLVPTDGGFQPLARCRLLAQQARDAGVRLFERTRVEHVARGLVRTDAGAVHADRVIVAVDGALDRVFPELQGRVRTARLQMLATAPAPEVRIPRPVYARWGYDYWQQLPDGRVALGGARDVGGDDEWTHDAVPSAPVQGALDRILRERLGVRAPVTHRWAAAVAYTADGVPIADELRPGVWACGAYSGTGNVVGALLGRAMAERVLTGRSAVLEAFVP